MAVPFITVRALLYLPQTGNYNRFCKSVNVLVSASMIRPLKFGEYTGRYFLNRSAIHG